MITRLFNENFCTDDFDQDMLDFIANKYPNNGLFGSTDDSPPNLEDRHLHYGRGIDSFFTDNGGITGWVKLTKQEFKDKIGMVDKEFNIKDLKDGMTTVYRDGEERVVFNGRLYKVVDENLHHKANLSDFNSDMTFTDEEDLDIMSVIDRDGSVLFVRKEAQINLELNAIEKQIAELQEKADKLKQYL